MQKNTFYNKFASKALVAFERAEPSIPIVGLFSVIGFPLFYFIWSYLLPQPYENLIYRLINTFIGVPFLFYGHLLKKFKKYFPVYFFIGLLFLLPFFFSFMLYKNAWHITWFISNLTALFLLIMLIDDGVLIFLLTITGYSLALATVWVLDGKILFTYFQWMYVPTFLFLFLGGAVGSHRKQIAHQTKISLLHSLSGSVAHEMRNPLNAIINAMGSVQSILPEKPDRDAADSDYTLSRSGLISLHNVVEESTTTVLRANKIIDSILAAMQGKSIDPSSFKRVSAKDSIGSAISNFSFSSSEDRHLVKKLSKNDFDFLGDKDLFLYVLFNLIKNALHYKEKPGFKIEISTENDSNWNMIKVKDTGPGIAVSKREKIFDSFYSFGKKGGVGLGLAFCKRVVNSFGGTIKCDSKENEWTEFTICLPLYNSRVIKQLKKEVLRTKNILVIDHNPANRFLAEKYFTEWGCRIDQAENSAQALSLLTRKKYDMILMEMEMPVMSGNEVSGRIRKGEFTGPGRTDQYKNVPIIGIASQSGTAWKQKTVSTGMNRHLTKPLTQEQVISLFEDFFFSEEKPDTETPVAALENKRGLVVDDNTTSRKFMSIILEHMGMAVTGAENGEEAIECLEKEEFDIVFMDIEMPVLNGIETTRRIREGSCFKTFGNYKNIPIIAMTGNTDPGNIALTKQSGMNGHLGKPVERKDLTRVLSTCLREQIS